MIGKSGFVKGNANFSLHEQRRLADKKIVKHGSKEAQAAKNARQIAPKKAAKDGMGGVHAQEITGAVVSQEIDNGGKVVVGGSAGLLFNPDILADVKNEAKAPYTLDQMYKTLAVTLYDIKAVSSLFYNRGSAEKEAIKHVDKLMELHKQDGLQSKNDIFDSYMKHFNNFLGDGTKAYKLVEKSCELAKEPGMKQVPFKDICAAMQSMSMIEQDKVSWNPVKDTIKGADVLAQATQKYGHERFSELAKLYVGILNDKYANTPRAIDYFNKIVDDEMNKNI